MTVDEISSGELLRQRQPLVIKNQFEIVKKVNRCRSGGIFQVRCLIDHTTGRSGRSGSKNVVVGNVYFLQVLGVEALFSVFAVPFFFRRKKIRRGGGGGYKTFGAGKQVF
jgi:hypothetical protein